MASFCRAHDKYLDEPLYSNQSIPENSPSHIRWLFILSLVQPVYFPQIAVEKLMAPSSTPSIHVAPVNDYDETIIYNHLGHHSIDAMWRVVPRRRTTRQCLFDFLLYDRVYDLWTVFHDSCMMHELLEASEISRSSLIRRLESLANSAK